jgi:hypothetical protein
MKTRMLMVAALALLVAAALAVPALAAHKAGTTVTIKYNGDGFQGKVKSARAKCVGDRTVKVYKQQGSTPYPSTDQKLYTDTSDSSGRWDTGTSGQVHGKFYARVKGTTSCKAATSATIHT